MLNQSLEIVFYGLCIAQGLVGWLAFGISIDDRFNWLAQDGFTLPVVAPVRRLFLSGMAWSLMFACVLAWIAPMWSVALTWAGFAFAASNIFVPLVMQYGLKGPLWVSRDALVALAIRVAVASFLTWQAPRMV